MRNTNASCKKPNPTLLNFRKTAMKSKIIQTIIECVLAIIIFGGWGVLLAWRG
jgi:hypothetical protein